MRTPGLSQGWKSLASAVALSAVMSLPAHAATTWYVSNYGSDAFNTPSCGSKTLPCRSISKAISLAATGDTIIVGPGVYGDINGNGTFEASPSGDEAAEIGSGCDCMVKVNKALTIVSRDGAEVTILEAAGLTQTVVEIQAAGAVFGKPSKGFTIRKGALTGLRMNPPSSSGSVAGNIATENATGFDVVVASGNLGKPLLTDNVATQNAYGFALHGNYHALQRNRAVFSTVAGFLVAGIGENLKQNVAVENNYGFEVDMIPPLGHPFANCPNCFGFSTNSAIGNATAGVFVQDALGTGGLAFMEKTNAFGNGDPANNCGGAIDNQVASTSLSASLDIFYWGAATGVGPNPADTAGGVCVTGAGAASVTEFHGEPATKEFMIAEKPLK